MQREWARQFGGKDKVVGWPAKCFEHFLVVGLPPTADVNSAVADAITAQSAKQVSGFSAASQRYQQSEAFYVVPRQIVKDPASDICLKASFGYEPTSV